MQTWAKIASGGKCKEEIKPQKGNLKGLEINREGEDPVPLNPEDCED